MTCSTTACRRAIVGAGVSRPARLGLAAGGGEAQSQHDRQQVAGVACPLREQDPRLTDHVDLPGDHRAAPRISEARVTRR
jgi:hypothetical protein